MNIVIWTEQRFRASADVVNDRIRAAILRARGASFGAKLRIGARCTVQRPWCLFAGDRVQFEHDIFIKITNDAAQLKLGQRVFIGRATQFDISEGVSVGNNVLIAPGCFITDHSHIHRAGASIASQGCESAPVRIGDDVWLGAHSIVLAGVTIGNGAIIGANSVVTRDVASMTIVAGSPARVVGART